MTDYRGAYIVEALRNPRPVEDIETSRRLAALAREVVAKLRNVRDMLGLAETRGRLLEAAAIETPAALQARQILAKFDEEARALADAIERGVT